jgi:hypothetical protein
VSYNNCPKIYLAGARFVSMQIDTTFSSFFKIQVSKTKSYHNINPDASTTRVKFVEACPPLHLLWPGKAALHVPLSLCHLGLVVTVDLFDFVVEGMWQDISNY